MTLYEAIMSVMNIAYLTVQAGRNKNHYIVFCRQLTGWFIMVAISTQV